MSRRDEESDRWCLTANPLSISEGFFPDDEAWIMMPRLEISRLIVAYAILIVGSGS